ncbi:uncharacterized protein LOC123526520 [Mercenaria mercenaria]|uniref:uncharacterized protein LOC123526520 n=1 Tax=Mercenaria mercenaria TaxID=6596 RepID=UPI00234ED4D6|nr:uncharacterized protein LOC123526520 [Mercenaria mercenaria]
MELKIVLCFVLFAGFRYADCCGRGGGSFSKNYRPYRSVDDRHANGQEGSVEKIGAHYSVTPSLAHPCTFETYDADRNGEISKIELQAVLGIGDDVDSLFADLDIMPDDGVIKPDEFSATVPLYITVCLDTAKLSI